MNYIITSTHGRISIVEMFNMFSFSVPVEILSVYKNKKENKVFWRRFYEVDGNINVTPIEQPTFSKEDKIIYWGTRVNIQLNGAIVYNHPENTSKSSNKALTRYLFEKEGIPIPKTFHSLQEALNAKLYPYVIRPTHHHAGNDFYVANNDAELRQIVGKMDDFYISELYPKTKEFRVHCAMGKILLTKEKPKPENENNVAWNFAQNEQEWNTINRKDYNFDISKLALDAMKAIGLDFGAVDIMSYPKRDDLPEHVVLEINTSPSFTPYISEKYGMIFDKVFREKGKLKHFDYSQFKKAKSFAWKNFQLKK